jgi:hypothetical protein
MPRSPSPILLLLSAVALFPGVPAAAATTVGAGVNVLLNGDVLSELDSVDDTLAEGRLTASAAAGAGTAEARARGDAGRGTMDVRLVDIDGDGSVGISSDFTAHGSGEVAFFFDTTAAWNRRAPGATFFETHLVAGDGFLSDYFEGDPGPGFQSSGSLAHRVSYTATVVDGARYYLAATVFASLFVDGPSSASIGGVLGYRPAAGVSLAFDDPGFLAAPVPLPPAALLLAGGLFGLALLGWRAERGRGAAPTA